MEKDPWNIWGKNWLVLRKEQFSFEKPNHIVYHMQPHMQMPLLMYQLSLLLHFFLVTKFSLHSLENYCSDDQMANSPVTKIKFLVSSALFWFPFSSYPLQKEILVTHSKFKANENNLTKSRGEQSRLAGIQNVNWSGNVSKAALVLHAWRDWIDWNVPPGWWYTQSLGPHSLWNTILGVVPK